jgi:hypothetical protein
VDKGYLSMIGPTGKADMGGTGELQPGKGRASFSFGRIFCGCAAKNRAIRGCGFASGPACGVAAPHPSYPLRCPKMTSCHFWAWGFASQNPKDMETAGILPASSNGIRAVFSPFGVFASQKLQGMVTAGIHAGLKQ